MDDNREDLDGLDGDGSTTTMTVKEPTSPVEEEIVHHRYNLRNKDTIGYRSMHRYGETQLMQLQQEWVKKILNNDKSQKHSEARTLIINTDDLYRRIVGVTLTQLSKEDKYTQVSVKEGVKRHGDKAIQAVMKEFS